MVVDSGTLRRVVLPPRAARCVERRHQLQPACEVDLCACAVVHGAAYGVAVPRRPRRAVECRRSRPGGGHRPGAPSTGMIEIRTDRRREAACVVCHVRFSPRSVVGLGERVERQREVRVGGDRRGRLDALRLADVSHRQLADDRSAGDSAQPAWSALATVKRIVKPAWRMTLSERAIQDVPTFEVTDLTTSLRACRCDLRRQADGSHDAQRAQHAHQRVRVLEDPPALKLC